MAENETRLQRLEDIRLRFAQNPEVLTLVDSAINKAKITQGVAPKEVVAQALLVLTKALTQASTAGSNLNEDEVKRILREDLANNKITLADLDETVTTLLQGKAATYTFTYQPIGGTPVTAKGKIDPLKLANPLVQLILSDMVARNNVYLYGPAGTGKTYIAEVISELLGWKLITVTCNQFTSPLNLIGGQTIEGYQEGLVTTAWGRLATETPKDEEGNPLPEERVAGSVLLLDELPKLDPNTAGVMNDALAKVKRQKSITNGRGDEIPMDNCFIMATGNVRLNEIDEDYVANFKQDLSLQDRFVGSCYPILVQYDYQVKDIMKGYLFIWEYMTDLSKAIAAIGAQAQAFVSNRIMESLRDTQKAYAGNLQGLAVQPIKTGLIDKQKTLLQGVRSFLSLFEEADREQLMKGVEIVVEETITLGKRQSFKTTTRPSQSFEDFSKLVAQKNATEPKFDLDKSDPNYGYDTPEENEAALGRAKAHDSIQLKVYER